MGFRGGNTGVGQPLLQQLIDLGEDLLDLALWVSHHKYQPTNARLKIVKLLRNSDLKLCRDNA